MTTTDKRKAQQREASKKNRKNKKADGFVDYRRKVLPEWRKILDDVLAKLRLNYNKK